ncbi:histidine phosphatase family protein [Deinococcus arcticus]|nr:histidine phosphatase family protein [Deinococcus arcticus]
MTRITLVRHGQTAHNAAGRFQGWADIALNGHGQAQAAALARRLAGHPVRPTHVLSSDLGRAAQTAAPLAHALGLPVQPSADLREIHIGAWEGLTFAEIEAQDADRFRQWPLVAAPQGESVADLTRRVGAVLDRLALQPTDHAVIVTHGVVITALLCTWLGWDFADAWAGRRGLHHNTALSTLRWADEAVQCETLACAAHLEDLQVGAG